ncbi:MAG: GNAT family N-acetyltransferase [Actinobacteria bacterium]|nr:GNAT family N-acetyltransferase [Actinomycetota bacterium]
MLQHPPIDAPLPDVQTKRLTLRRFAAEDLGALEALFAKPEVWQFPYGRGLTREETGTFLDAQLREWDGCGFGCWLAIEHATDRVVGYAGLSVPTFLPEVLPAVEVGWRFDPNVWGRGYASESAAAALDQAFTTLGLDEVCSIPEAQNERSSRVAERLGMRLARLVTIPANERRGALDARLYTISRTTWLAPVGE